MVQRIPVHSNLTKAPSQFTQTLVHHTVAPSAKYVLNQEHFGCYQTSQHCRVLPPLCTPALNMAPNTATNLHIHRTSAILWADNFVRYALITLFVEHSIIIMVVDNIHDQ